MNSPLVSHNYFLQHDTIRYNRLTSHRNRAGSGPREQSQLTHSGRHSQPLPCYAIMPYSKVMAKEDFMSSLYKNRMNLTIEVLDLCMPAFASVRNQLK